jgi:hypothetical protein
MTKNKTYQPLLLSLLMLSCMYSCDQTNSTKETSEKKDTVTNTEQTSQPVRLKLNAPRPERDAIVERPLTPNVLTVIALEGTRIYYYTGGDFTKGQYGEPTGFTTNLLKNKKQWGDSIFVMIKPSSLADNDALINILDQMAIHTIKHYAIIDPSPEEQTHFKIKPLDLTSGELTSGVPKIMAEVPTETVRPLNTAGDFVIFLSKTNIEYKINSGAASAFIPIEKNKKGRLEEAVRKYRKQHPNGQILITGHKEAKYVQFAFVVDELKAANEMKYQLVTKE